MATLFTANERVEEGGNGTASKMSRLGFALARFGMETGRLPDSLEELLPEYVPSESELTDGWGREIYYMRGENAEFLLASFGESGVPDPLPIASNVPATEEVDSVFCTGAFHQGSIRVNWPEATKVWKGRLPSVSVPTVSALSNESVVTTERIARIAELITACGEGNGVPRKIQDLVPTMLDSPDELKDGWGRTFYYIPDRSFREFLLVSFGSDGRPDRSPTAGGGRLETTDIVYLRGFLQGER